MKKSELEEFASYLEFQGKSQGTIGEYTSALKRLPTTKTKQEKYLSNPKLKNRRIVMYAFRQYVAFLYHYNRLTLPEKQQLLERYQYKAKKGGKKNATTAYPKKEWATFIKKSPHRVAKMGLWLGFNFGLRVGEIVHLRVEDINLRGRTLRITEYNRKDEWVLKTKYSEREFVLNDVQYNVLVKWIDKRPSMDHEYLLYHPRLLTKVSERAFQRWCQKVGLKSHDLRRSYATHLYYQSGKDLPMVKEALGHSNIAVTSAYLVPDNSQLKNRIAKVMSE